MMRSAAASTPNPPRAGEALRAAGLDRLDAEVLLAHVLGRDRAALHAAPEQRLTAAQAARFAALAARRRAGEPVAYLTGRRAFRWLELTVDERVLIPRPETEGLVEAALTLPAGARVVDVGTGSGAVGLALAHERPDLEVVATDCSAPALAVARANAARLRLRVELRQADLLEGIEGRLDAVVSNPPYVPAGERLARDVDAYEPAEALRAGPDGLAVIRRLVPRAAARAPFVALEVGAGQAGAVTELCRAAGYADVEARRDLAGIERIVVARR
jgi:release factor glutamine methyltransferase